MPAVLPYITAAAGLASSANSINNSNKQSRTLEDQAGKTNETYKKLGFLLDENTDNPYITQTNSYLDSLSKKLNSMPTTNNFQTGASNYFNKVMGDDYQAYSEPEMKQMFEGQKENLITDVFDPLEKRQSSKLAGMGLTGSGAGRGKWIENVSTPEKRILADTYNQIRTEGRNLTNQNRGQAFNMAPSLSSEYTQGQYMPINTGMQLAGQYGNLSNIYAENKQRPINNYMNYAALLSNQYNQQAAAQQQQSASQGQLLGSLMDKLGNIKTNK